MTTANKILLAVGVVVIVVLAALYTFSGSSSSQKVGAVTPASHTQGSYVVDGSVTVGGDSGVQSYSTNGSCNSASSTVFATKNPFAATSTAQIVSLNGIANATTTTLNASYSTKSSVSSLTGTLIKDASIATSTAFQVFSGVTTGSSNFVSAGSGSVRSIVVGPSDYVVAYATTSAKSAGAKNFAPGYSNCSYKVLWTD